MIDNRDEIKKWENKKIKNLIFPYGVWLGDKKVDGQKTLIWLKKKIERMENIVYINLKLCLYYIKQNVTFFLLKNCAWTFFF